MKLYKYYAVNGVNLTALINQQFWASMPSSFNDPYDTPAEWLNLQTSMVLKPYALGDGRVELRFSQDIEQPTRPYTSNEIDEARSMGVICFSKSNDEILMWSHYADQHRGFVLEFDFPDNAGRRLVDVCYEQPEYVFQHFGKVGVHRYKSEQWSYEREVRLILDHGDMLYGWDQILPNREILLTSVLFGVRASESTKSAISKIVKNINPDVNIMNVTLGDKAFSLSVD